MDQELEIILDELLAATEAGVPISDDWIRKQFPEHAITLHRSLLLAGPPAQAPPAPQRLGPCRLLHEIGRGGAGIVYSAELLEEAWDLPRRTRVAVKVLRPGLGAPRRLARAMEEEWRLGAAVRHPNVVRAYGFHVESNENGTWFCLFMELVEGTVLDRYLDDPRVPTEAFLRHVGLEITSALAGIHAHGVVHRDIKPHNILVAPDGRVRLMDLGAARLAAINESGFAGSIPYAAPEQFVAGESVDARADLFALGATLAELALGRRRKRRDTPAIPARFSPFFESFVVCLLEPSPARRFASAADAHRALLEGEESAWWRGHSPRASALRAPLGGHRLLERQAELERLAAAREHAHGHGARAVLVEGEAGIGKSALLVEFAARAGETVLLGRYQPDSTDSAVATLLAQLPNVARHLDALRGHPQLVDAFRGWVDGRAVGAPMPPDAKLAFARELFRRAARAQPLILFIEDLHFAPREEWDLIRGLVRHPSVGPVLLLCSTRPSMPEGRRGNFGADVLRVPPLSGPSIRELLCRASQPADLLPSRIADIAQRAAGNPQVALLLLAAEERPDVPHQPGIEGRDAIVRRALARRHAALAESDRALLELAACAGPEFETAFLARALGTQPDELARRLARSEELRAWFVPRGDRLAFDHHLTHEALVAIVPAPRCALCHAALARALAEMPEEGRDPSRLVLHALRGGLDDVARAGLRDGVNQLFARGQPSAAITLLGEALDAPLFEEGEERFELLRELAGLLMNLERGAEARVRLRQCSELARRIGPAAEASVLSDHADVGRLDLDFEYSERHARQALALLDESGLDEPALRVSLFHSLLQIADHRQQWADAAGWIRRIRNLRDPFARFVAMLCAGKHRLDRGQRESGARSLRAARAVAEAGGEPSSVMQAEALLGIAEHGRGHFRDAQRAFRKTLRISRRIHASGLTAIILGRLGVAEGARGRLARALQLINESLARLQETGQRPMIVSTQVSLTGLLLLLGDPVRARAAAERAGKAARGITATRYAGLALGALARVEWYSQDRPRAYALFEDAFRLVSDADWPWAAIEIQTQWIEALWLDGRIADATAILREVNALPPRDDPAGAIRRLAWGSLARDRDPNEAADFLERYRERIDGATRAHAHYLLWSATGDDAHLAQARRGLDRLVRFAPPQYEDSVVDGVALHRLIRAGDAL